MREKKTTKKKPVLIPLMESPIHAGFPSPATDYREKSIDLNDLLIRNAPATFITNVEGDSWMPYIPPKAKVIIDRSITPKNKDTIAAVIDGDFNIRKLSIAPDGGITLLAPNPDYPPIKITKEMKFEVWGVVSNVIIDPKQIKF